jgi:hypothetical protein
MGWLPRNLLDELVRLHAFSPLSLKESTRILLFLPSYSARIVLLDYFSFLFILFPPFPVAYIPTQPISDLLCQLETVALHMYVPLAVCRK